MGWHRFALVLVIALAAFLRFDGITDVGIRFEDEGLYMSDARLWHRCALLLTDATALQAALNRDKKAYQNRMAEIGVDFTARLRAPSQGYTFLGALVMFVTGDRPAALLLVTALCGTLTVVIVYFLCSLWFDRWTALLAALCLAVSPAHLTYSRLALTNATGGMFMLMGVLVWAFGRSRQWSSAKTYVLSGIPFGYAVACHWSLGYICALPIFVDLVGAWQSGRSSGHPPLSATWAALKKSGWLVVGVGIPLLLIEAVFTAARLAATITDSYLPVESFFGTAVFCLKKQLDHNLLESGSADHLAVAASHLGYFLHWHGAIGALLAVLGFIVLLRATGRGKFVALMVTVSILLILSQRFHMARSQCGVLPFACICIAGGIVWLSRVLRPIVAARATAAAAALLFIVPAFYNCSTLVAKRSSLADACDYVRAAGNGTALVPNFRRYWIYLEGSGSSVVSAETLSRDESAGKTIAHLRQRGVRWVFTDPQRWHHGAEERRWWNDIDRILDDESQLVARFPHLSDYRWEFMAEGTWGMSLLGAMVSSGAGPIRIYDLQAGGNRAAPAVAHLDAPPLSGG